MDSEQVGETEPRSDLSSPSHVAASMTEPNEGENIVDESRYDNLVKTVTEGHAIDNANMTVQDDTTYV